MLSTLFLVMCSVQAHAQLREMVVTQTNASEVVDVPISEYPEDAVLSIRSSIPGLKFDSNMGGIVADRSTPGEGRHVLVVEAYTQIFTVQAPGYIQARFPVASLRAGEVRAFTIEPSNPQDNLLLVNFLVEPLGASLFVNGSQEDPSRPVQLAEGEHRIRVEAAGHRALNETIMVSRNQTLFPYSLDLLEEEVMKIRSSPPGASVYVDNLLEGTTPYDNFYYPGDYLIRLTLDGYRELERQITIVEGQDSIFTLEMERFTSRLDLDVTPSDAIIRVDGRNIGQERQLELRPGYIRIDVEKDGYYPFTGGLVVEAGEDVVRTIVLEPRMGTLQFRVLPVDATARLVHADGRVEREWTGTDIIRDIPQGSYDILAQAEGFEPQSVPVNIRERETSPMFIDLTRPLNPSPGAGTAAASAQPPANTLNDVTRTNQVSDPAPNPATSAQPAAASTVSLPAAGNASTSADGITAVEPLRFAEQMPEPIGGLDAIYSKVRYPRRAASSGIEGVVIVEFTVNIRGEVEEAVVLRSIGGGCDEEALRVIAESSFKPGVNDGRAVPIRMALPFRFQLAR